MKPDLVKRTITHHTFDLLGTLDSPIVEPLPATCGRRTSKRSRHLKIRTAQPEDVQSINALTARSIRALHGGYYDESVINSAIDHAYGVDWQLVRDGGYFVAEIEGELAGAGGWSWRETIAGAHGPDDPPGEPLDPAKDAARIRAFYVEPKFVRHGIGTALLSASEAAAMDAGFKRATLTSTLPAVPFYSAHGYRKTGEFVLPLPGELSLELVRMEKSLGGGAAFREAELRSSSS